MILQFSHMVSCNQVTMQLKLAGHFTFHLNLVRANYSENASASIGLHRVSEKSKPIIFFATTPTRVLLKLIKTDKHIRLAKLIKAIEKTYHNYF